MTTTQKRRKPGTVKALAAGLGITRRAAQQALALGMPDTLPEAKQWREERQSGDNSVQRLRQERIALVVEQRRRAEIENAVRRGELVPASESFKSGMMLGFELKQNLTKFVAEVVPQLEGLSCVDIYKVLKSGLHKILASMSSNTAFTSPELEKLIAEFEAARPEPWTPIKPTIK